MLYLAFQSAAAICDGSPASQSGRLGPHGVRQPAAAGHDGADDVAIRLCAGAEDDVGALPSGSGGRQPGAGVWFHLGLECCQWASACPGPRMVRSMHVGGS